MRLPQPTDRRCNNPPYTLLSSKPLLSNNSSSKRLNLPRPWNSSSSNNNSSRISWIVFLLATLWCELLTVVMLFSLKILKALLQPCPHKHPSNNNTYRSMQLVKQRRVPAECPWPCSVDKDNSLSISMPVSLVCKELQLNTFKSRRIMVNNRLLWPVLSYLQLLRVCLLVHREESVMTPKETFLAYATQSSIQYIGAPSTTNATNSSAALSSSSSSSSGASALISPQKQSAASATAAAIQQQQQYQYAYSQQQQSASNGSNAYYATMAQAQSQQQQQQQQQQLAANALAQQQQLNLISQVKHRTFLRSSRWNLDLFPVHSASICQSTGCSSTTVLHHDGWPNNLPGRWSELHSRSLCGNDDDNDRSSRDVFLWSRVTQWQ